MSESHFCCSSGKSSTVPVLLPKKYMPLTLWCWLMLKSTLPTAFFTPTSLLNPLGMLMVGSLFVGKPVPLQLTVAFGGVPESAHPATCRLAGLMVTPPACRSAITSGMLSAQSPVAVNRQVVFVGIVTIEGLVIPPNELATSYI